MKRQRFEAICGSLAGLLGLFGLIYIVFGPTYSFAGSSGRTGTTNWLQAGMQPSAIIILCILLLGLIGAATSAIFHSRTGESRWKIILGISTAILIVLMLLTLPSIGVFLLPSVLLAIVAFVFALVTRNVAFS